MFSITESDRAFWLEGPNGQRMRLCGKDASEALGTQKALTAAVNPWSKRAYDDAMERAEAAEKRVKELEAEAAALSAESEARADRIVEQGRRITQLEAERNEAEKRVEALEGAGLGKELGERDVLMSTITQLEADLARLESEHNTGESVLAALRTDLAAAKTLQAHKLVADVVETARDWMEDGAAGASTRYCNRLVWAVQAAAGITVQPVRTYTREEAEALAGRLKEAAEFVGSHQGGETASETRALSEALDAVESALMSAPVAPAAKAWPHPDCIPCMIDQMPVDHTLRGKIEALAGKRIEDDEEWAEVMADRATGIQQTSEVLKVRNLASSLFGVKDAAAPQVPKLGADEAGGEGPAAAPLKAEDLPVFELPSPEPDEVERLLVEAEGLMGGAQDVYDTPGISRMASAVDELIRAIRILNARK